jgi:hypothetical protein
MEFELTYTEVKPDQVTSIIAIQQKIAAIDDLIVGISNERAELEAGWRKRENYLKTEKGKLEIELRSMTKATLTEIEV